jgi:phosphoglycolate phosphatase-like HAD superfamily hydrolase
MPLRIGFDMDGVLADFRSAYHDVELRLFGPGTSSRPDDPEEEEEAESQGDEVRLKPDATTDAAKVRLKPDATTDGNVTDAATKDAATTDASTKKVPTVRQLRRRHEAIWAAIRATPDFWRTLKPTEHGAVARIHALMLEHRWEVFFITQRPATEGDTVQRQTQHWLVDQGFDLPSVLVLGGSRGAAAGALRLNYHVDDSAQNCIDVLSDSRARPILILPEDNGVMVAKAKTLGIGTATSISECLDVLEQATIARTRPTVLGRLAALVGWK